MKRETEIALIERLLSQSESGVPAMGPEEGRLSTSVYSDPTRFELEKKILFRQRPIVVAPAAALPQPGDVVTHDALGTPILLTRDRQGTIHAFLNVCRHRGSRLVLEDGPRKALVCGYHGWTYGLDGGLMHIPQPEGFPRTDCDRGLIPLPVAERGGLIWVLPTPGMKLSIADYLGPLASELEGLGIAQHSAHRTATVRRRFNWKLLIDAFLDGYHIRVLHRSSVYRFFQDNMSVSDDLGPHIRSVVARRSLAEARTTPRETWDFRSFLSLTYFLFPNTVLVFHPDWVSRITLFPVSPGETDFVHTMLIPPGSQTEEQRPHWDRTWSMIHETVFEKEDMAAGEWIQSGLSSGANETFAIGRYEYPILTFHQSVARALVDG